MAHRFDSGLGAPLRRVVRDSIVTALRPLLLRNGGYVFGNVHELPSPLRFGQADDEILINELLEGGSPSVGVALGSSTFSRTGTSATILREKLSVYVYVFVRHQRGPMAGLKGDVASANVTKDPGAEVVLEHCLERVASLPGASGQIGTMLLESCSPVYYGADWQVWEQSYSVLVEYKVNQSRGSGVVDSVLADHIVSGSPAEPAQTLTTLETPTP